MPDLSLSFIGPLQITHAQRGELSLANRKALALLAYLAVEWAQPHSRESILGLLWPDLPNADARNNLRVTWSQLTAQLGQDDADEPYLLSNRLELQFNGRSNAWRDVAEFEQLLADCDAHPHQSRSTCPACQERLAHAATLYRGEFLAGLSLNDCPAFDEWQFVQRERLHLKAVELLDDLANFYERTGQYAVAERYARRQIELDPIRESAHRQLMRLLDALGQRAAALTQYENCKRVLVAELGVEPEPETMLLAARIRHGLADSSQTRKHNLPAPLTQFVGREQDIATLVEQMTDAHSRLITLTGAGGVGKTRLALRVAHELVNTFADGVWLVELAAISDAQSVERATAAALNVRAQADAPLTQTLSNVVRDKQMLLVVDNCEHLPGACAMLISQLLAVAPRLKVLATSRSPLHSEGERVQGVRSLSLPKRGATLSAEALMTYEAIQLFVNCALAAQSNFALNATNAAAVLQICRRLDGIPLALELAAARVKVMPVENIAQRLERDFSLLTAGSPTALPRQRTLQASVAWSYNLLPPDEQALLRRLTTFAGGWSLEAAEAVCVREDGSSVLDALLNLVNHSLVVFGQDAKRYTMLESIRQFAHEQLQVKGEELAARASHARYYAQVVAEAAPYARSATHQQALDAIELEHDNVLAALVWAIQHDTDLALNLEADLGHRLEFWELRGHFDEGRHWLGQLLQATQDKPTRARARVLLDAAWLESALPNYAQALLYAEASASLCDELGDAFGKLDAQLFIARHWSLHAETAKCQALAQVCVEQGEQLGYKRITARGLSLLGVCEEANRAYESAQSYFDRSINLWREIGDRWGMTGPLTELANLLSVQSKYADAQALYEELESIDSELGYERGLALTQNNLGDMLMAQGTPENYARAKSLFVSGLLIRRKMGLRLGYVYSFVNFAALAERENQNQRAARLFGAAEALCETLGLTTDAINFSKHAAAFARLHTALGELRFNLEWQRGRSLTPEQAIEIALGE